ncbi:MAG: sugar phosphate isomerase/epimerase [Spirochaetaceae bacterium]|nr:MAG: sugar phosphate isomerase/epimerase [Spirochaetaceae bacterium]
MKIGVDSYSFQIALAAGVYDVFRTIDSLGALGVSGIQININGPDGRFLGGEPTDGIHVRRVRRAIEAAGFFVEVGGRSTRPDMLGWQLDLCAELGADVLRTLLVFEESLDATLERTERDLESSLPRARELGVTIALENHEDVTAAELLECLERIDDPYLAACLDTGNDLVLHGDPLDSARLLAPRAVTTHIKDQKLIRVAQTVYSVGVPLGLGDVDLPAILGAIARESSLDRVLVQDTTGYSVRLNPFGRTDLAAARGYDDLPAYDSPAALLADGLVLSLDDLAPEQLQKAAAAKADSIARDVEYVRAALEKGGR